MTVNQLFRPIMVLDPRKDQTVRQTLVRVFTWVVVKLVEKDRMTLNL